MTTKRLYLPWMMTVKEGWDLLQIFKKNNITVDWNRTDFFTLQGIVEGIYKPDKELVRLMNKYINRWLNSRSIKIKREYTLGNSMLWKDYSYFMDNYQETIFKLREKNDVLKCHEHDIPLYPLNFICFKMICEDIFKGEDRTQLAMNLNGIYYETHVILNHHSVKVK